MRRCCGLRPRLRRRSWAERVSLGNLEPGGEVMGERKGSCGWGRGEGNTLLVAGFEEPRVGRVGY